MFLIQSVITFKLVFVFFIHDFIFFAVFIMFSFPPCVLPCYHLILIFSSSSNSIFSDYVNALG